MNTIRIRAEIVFWACLTCANVWGAQGKHLVAAAWVLAAVAAWSVTRLLDRAPEVQR